MTPKQMLEVWGLRVSGEPFTSWQLSTGNPCATADDAMEVVRYVESSRGFHAARPMLLHVFAHGKKLATFVWRDPAVDLNDQIDELGWYQCYDFRPEEMAGSVFRGFVWSLERRLLRFPFVPPSKRITIEEAAEPDLPEADRLRVAVAICRECATLNGGRYVAQQPSWWGGRCFACNRERSVCDIGDWDGLRISASALRKVAARLQRGA
jgi:hypothetical protein